MKIEWRTRLDLEAFREALDSLVAGTDALRICFVEVNAEPFQYAKTECEVALEVRDFSQSDAAQQKAIEWLSQIAKIPFDLSDRVFSTSLAKCADDHWIWQLNQHHIVTDFTSSGLIIQRLSDIYQQRLRSGTTTTETFPSFLSYNIETQEPETLESVSGAAPPPRLCPTFEQATNILTRSTRLKRLEFHLGSNRLRELRDAFGLPQEEVAKRFNSQLFNLFLCATVAFVNRVSGEQRISIGTPSHNRFSEGSDTIVGPLMCTLPLTIELEDDWTVDDLFRNVASRRRDVFRSARTGVPANRDLYNVIVNYIPNTMPPFNGVRSNEITAVRDSDAVGIDLSITIRGSDTEGDIKVLFDVHEEIADALGLDRLAQIYLRVFDALTEDRAVPVAAIPLCSVEEVEAAQAHAIVAANHPAPPFISIPEAFVAQAHRLPDAVAIFEADRSISYAQLEEYSHRIACSLAAQGIGRNDVVALRLPRSIDLVASMLGIMRSSATILALDTDVPGARAEGMLRDSGAKLLILPIDTDARFAEGLVSAIDLATLVRDVRAGTVDLPEIDPETAVYVMYTSGTDGAPKGVMIPHSGFSRYTHWASQQIAGNQPISWALATTLSFESAYRMFMPLYTGGAIGAYHAPDGLTGMSLVHALQADAVDGVAVTPSQLRFLVNEKWSLQRIRTILVIGEQLPTDLALQAQSAFGPGVSIQNWYGPTEAVMATTMHRFDPSQDTGHTVPIGLPAPDTTVQILDAGMNPLPQGLIGEMFIGGIRLSKGYLNLPELNKKSFLRDPFRPGGVVYKTGDLCRVNERGEIVHHGRTDHQVKINGVRTELAEVELSILQHPDVAKCVTVAVGSPSLRIAAFYVADNEISPAELRSFVGAVLPRAMIPSTFTRIDEVPLLQNGKIDRKYLQSMAPEASFDTPSSTHPISLSPRGKTEIALAEIWGRLLKTPRIGRLDDFFDLGGDSLAFVQMILFAERKFEVLIAPDEIAKATKLSEIARVIASRRSTQDQAKALRGARSGRWIWQRTFKAPGALLNRTVRNPQSVVKDRDPKLLSVDASWEEIRRRLLHASRGWPGEHVGKQLPLLALNRTGSRTPLFWCFNAAHEPKKMARELGDDQPLFALRSMAAIVQRNAKLDFLNVMAREYANEILLIWSDGPFLLGGNCQSGKLAEMIARELMLSGHPVAKLLLLEYTPTTPYPASVSLFFGRDSTHFNPFFKHPKPQLAWKRLFLNVSWDIIPGNHSQYFSDTNVQTFCGRLNARMEEARIAAPVRLPPSYCVTRLSCTDPHLTSEPAQDLTITVNVENCGCGPWSEAASSGIALVARWEGNRTKGPTDYAAVVDLDRLLEPGDTWTARLKLCAPESPGLQILNLELLEQGIAPISARGTRYLRIEVQVVE